MGKKFVLPIKLTPHIQTYNNFACSFGIIEEKIENFEPWLCRHFIGLHYRKSWKKIVFNMRYSYHWSCFKSKICLIFPFSYESFLLKIKKCIDSGYYIYVCVNEKHIPKRLAYKKENYSHDLYIYGYDDEEKYFYTLGYNDKYKYCVQAIDYKTVQTAFNNRFPNFVFFAFKLKDGFNFVTERKGVLYLKILSYLYPLSKFYGINIYNYMCKLRNERLDLRNFRILVEHFWVLTKLGALTEAFEELYIKANETFLLAIKYNKNKSESLLLDINNKLNKIKLKEIDLLNEYVEGFGSNCLKKLLFIFTNYSGVKRK